MGIWWNKFHLKTQKMIKLFNIPNYNIDTSQFSNILHDKIVGELEREFAKYVGAKYACAVNSCTNAIFLALYRFAHLPSRSCFLPSLITTRFLNAIIQSNVKYEFTDNTGWVGGSFKMYEHTDFKIIDSAQKVEPDQFKKECNPQDILLFSFYPTKPIGSVGGGMIVTNDKEKIEWFKKATYFGETFSKNSWETKTEFVGWQMFMNSIQAWIAMENLKMYTTKIVLLNIFRNRYKCELYDMIVTGNSNHLFRIRVKDNEKFIKQMRKKNIICGLHYKPAHLNKVYNDGIKYDLPQSVIDGKTVVSIPFHEQLTFDELETVIKYTKKFR